MIVLRKMWSVLVVVLAFGLGVGCELGTSPEDEIINHEITVYSYNIDELVGGVFGAIVPTMTISEWVSRVSGQTYEQWVQTGFFLYQDENLKTPFTGSDIVDENTVIYCTRSLNQQGKKIGEITGTITLTDIPDLAAKVWIQNWAYSPGNYSWFFNRKIDIQEITGTGATVNWSLPVYKSFRPDSENTFQLVVLAGNLLTAYTVSVPTRKTISDANADVGDLGTVSVKGVTLSGTLNVTYNGDPVPYVEIYAIFEVADEYSATCLFSPGPDAPWTVIFGHNPNNRDIQFRVVGYSERKGTRLFDRAVLIAPPVWILDNQSVSGIVLNAGDITVD